VTAVAFFDLLLMSIPDQLLVAWWLLAAAVGIPSFILTSWSHRATQRAAVLSYLRGNPTGRYPVWGAMSLLPSPIVWILILSYAVLFFGAVGLMWMSHWTELLLLNLRAFIVLVGMGIAAMGLRASLFNSINSRTIRRASIVMRPIFILFGAAIVIAGLYALYEDTALPKLFVQGQINNMTYYYGRGFETKYFVVINGASLRATREVFLRLKTGDRVRAEIGAGSKVIVRAEPI